MTKSNIISLFLIMSMILLAGICCSSYLSPSIMCLNLILSTILTTFILSSKYKELTVPFIFFLTLTGGLMILFMYMSTVETKGQSSINFLPIFIILTSAYMLPSQIEYNFVKSDPSMLLFTPEAYLLSTLTLSLLSIFLIAVIKICLKTNQAIRRKLKIKSGKKNF